MDKRRDRADFWLAGGHVITASAFASANSGLRCAGNGLVSLLALEPRPLLELRCPVALALQLVQRDLAREGPRAAGGAGWTR